ncbi:ABC-type transport auxiliary lipoprotein family protein [Sulfitobacter sp. F26169L]|uniref:ABC-type transport auxiliary lipoprotein family protein n=1 Tax=Sulfitobacter sp. F26169L TaxID=2996015 RepID=UPI002260DB3C|nr:ABC-type transport auxiliary lipoprotein family protein [Sulfitobacter sp. F26169L]MCX7568225.1 ABC-type transport auxiliary lipoprotein family protein [Sulfitobacter sp. F26169L]
MKSLSLNRRIALLSAAAALGGCSAVASLNDAARPLDTYLLSPAAGSTSGARTSRTVLVTRPDAPAAIASDRIMVKTGVASISYLPDARWSDELPAVLQSLLIRSVSATKRVGYVGKTEGGPVPDVVVLVRLDRFEVSAKADETFEAVVDMAITMMDDQTQRVIATRSFSRTAAVADDSAETVTAVFQSVMNTLLPEASNWIISNARR